MGRRYADAREALTFYRKRLEWEASAASIRIGELWTIRYVTPPVRRAPPPPGAREILLKPSLVYGSGGHPSTRLALQALPEVLQLLGIRQPRVLDLGCGGGILSIAGARLGLKRITAMDISRAALAEAAVNARMNRVAIRFRSRLESGRRYDLVLANLHQPLHFEYLDKLARLTEKGSIILFSGLDNYSEPELSRLLRAYGKKGFTRIRRYDGEESHRALALVRQGDAPGRTRPTG